MQDSFAALPQACYVRRCLAQPAYGGGGGRGEGGGSGLQGGMYHNLLY